MPGTSHNVDPSFMNRLPVSFQEPALELIRFSSLKDLLIMRTQGPSQFMRDKYSLDIMQWNILFNAVILTKVSYFQIEINFPNRYIDKLIEIAAFAYDAPNKNAAQLYQAMLSDHPYFAEWLKNALTVKQQNLKLASNH